MPSLEATDYGYRIRFEELLEPAGVNQLLQDIKTRIPRRESFAVLVDLRQPRAFPVAAQEVLKLCLEALMEKGMGRQAIVLGTAIAVLQAQRLSKETGVMDLCRYFDATSDPDWLRRATNWLLHGIEP